MDIGCGNGSFFEKFCNCEEFKYVTKYGIEKSDILASNLPDDIILLGSDFHEQTLIDKKVDLIFCNPPYSEFEIWAEKIIKQGNAEKIALTGAKWQKKEYVRHSGYPGGLKVRTAEEMLEKQPQKIVEKAVICITPIHVGIRDDKLVCTYKKPCHGTFVILVDSPEDIANVRKNGEPVK